MFCPLRSRTGFVHPHRLRGADRRPSRIVLAIASAFLLAVSGMAKAAPFDASGFDAGEAVALGDGMTSVMVGEGGQSDGGIGADAGGGWTVSDGDEQPACSPESATAVDSTDSWLGWNTSCPPWNGVPGLINSHLGEACPRLIWTVDALMLWQGNVASRPLFLTNTVPPTTALDVNQIDAPVAVGPRVGLILNLTKCHGIEANWFQVEPFSGTQVLAPGASQYAMNDLAGLTASDIDSAVGTTSAAFKSFELNWRRRTCTPFTWLTGFRWVEWDQRLGIVNNYTDATVDPPVTGTDTVAVATGNNLFGGQVGLDALLWNTGRWVTVNGIAKAGAFYNYQAFQRTDVLGRSEVSAYPAPNSGTAFVGEVGVNGTVQICRWLAWRAGYNFFWLSGVAVPASQLSAPNQLNLAGSVFLHGVNTGLEARW